MNKEKILTILSYVMFIIIAYVIYITVFSKNSDQKNLTPQDEEIAILSPVDGAVAEETPATDEANAPLADATPEQINANQTALIEEYTKRIAANNNDADAYYKRAVVYQNAQQYSMAIADYTEVLRIIPKNVNSYYNRGIVKTQRKDFVGAIADLDDAIAIKSDDPVFFNARGIAYFGKGDLDKALIDYKKAIELDPNFDRAYYNLGTVYDKQSNFQEALVQYNKAITTNNNEVLDSNNKDEFNRLLESYFRRAIVYLQLADYAAALKDINFVLERETQNPQAYRLRSTIYSKMGNTAAAAEDENTAQNLGFEELLR